MTEQDNDVIDVSAEDMNAIIPFDPTNLEDLGFDLSIFGGGEFTEAASGGVFLPRLTIATADNKAGKDGQNVGHFILTTESGEYLDLGDWIAVLPIDEIGSRSHWFRTAQGKQLDVAERKQFNLPAQSCGSNNGVNPRSAYMGTKVIDHRNGDTVTIGRSCADCPLGKGVNVPVLHPSTGEPLYKADGKPQVKWIPPQCSEQPNYILYVFNDVYSGMVMWQVSGIALIYARGMTKDNKYAKHGGLIPLGQKGFGYWANKEKSPLYTKVPNTEKTYVPIRPLIIEASLDRYGSNTGDSSKKNVWVPVFQTPDRGLTKDEFKAFGRALQEYEDGDYRKWFSSERIPLAELPEPETPSGEVQNPF